MSHEAGIFGRLRGILPFGNLVVLSGALGGLVTLLASPDFIARMLSSDGIFEVHTVLEIQLWRASLAILSVSLLAGFAVWSVCAHTPWVSRVQRDYLVWCSPMSRLDETGRMWKSWSIVAGLASCLLAILVARLSFTYLGTRWFDLLALESGVVETFQAGAMLIAGLLLLKLAFADYYRSRNPLSFVGVMLGLALCLAAGEEVSWGQHWLGFATPEALAEVNVQGEFNFHNIGSYWMNHLQQVLFFLYVGAVPVLGYLFPQIHYALDRASLPIAPLGLFPLVVLGCLMDEHARIARIWGSPPWRLSEGRELVFATCMLMIVLLMRHYRRAAVLEERAATAS